MVVEAADRASLEAVHDLLVASKPAEVAHGPEDCGICAARAAGPANKENQVDTYTQEQLDARVAEANRELRQELDTLRASAETAAVEQQIADQVAAATAPLNDKVTELSTEVDTITAQLNDVTAERDALVQANVDRETAETAAAERDALIETRVAAICEVANFTDEQIADRQERWADMEEAAFETLVEDLRTQGAAGSRREAPPRPSALTAAETRRTPAGGGGSKLREAMSLRRQGVDVRSLV